MAFGKGFEGGYADLGMGGSGFGAGTIPLALLGLHQDALLSWLKRNYPIVSGEVVSALNEYNGIVDPSRKEYKEARDTAFGIHGH